MATGQTPRSRRLASPIREFIATQSSGAVVLLAATVAALVWANSPWPDSYEEFWHTELSIRLGDAELSLDIRHWVNDGLMALFFFVVGLEIRREFDMGELRERSRVATPVLAALGGMAVPALLYLAVNAGDGEAVHGWAIVMGTDTAFALGVLALAGKRASPRTRTFVLTAVIVDDVVALTIIAIAYSEDVSLAALAVAVALFGVVLVLKYSGVRHGVPYFIVGSGIWLATLVSGVHATLAGIALGLIASAFPPSREDLERVGAVWRLFREQPVPEYARTASRTLATAISPNERLQHLFHPWANYLIVPLFALANAGLVINADVLREAATSPITLGIVLGLVVGKPVGIVGVTWLASRFGFPLTVPWPQLIGAGTIGGVGFTVSLLIAGIAFEGHHLDDAKLGILAASVLATVLSLLVFRLIGHLPGRARTAGEDRLAAPIVDLADPVDPEADHIRGPADARVTLVEYGDFECPYCGRAEPVLRELTQAFGDDLTFVFRHLPLTDVHEHAQLAAEASEAAGRQGRFWELHDLLLTHQDALTYPDLLRYAEDLGLDVDRFARDLSSRHFALRVTRDVESAEQSGVAGTPTFFVNGQRHHGPYDLESLRAAITRELGATRSQRRDPGP
ncbi:Na+/H+ antiporter NhaA [Jiangella sp. DSM 45060]|uniref:Na+/H+ antiporter NhaA n=1 Tax=Jiangella sp. DSM 45060 TaxID=1798224 RepID=UPI00087C95F4|nr:Na+/H+ antiporter NhaA [Jiangella sp. DSM 45060]SDT72868.1 Na+/H+ antiporter NhaA [Jiangella sp. DSM 45060]